MMITSSQLYWCTRLDPISEFLGHCLGLLVFAAGICFIGFCASFWVSNEYCKDASMRNMCRASRNWLLLFLGLAGVVGAGRAFLPTTKEMAVIVVVPAIANSDFIQKDVPAEAKELYSYAKAFLKEQLPLKEDQHEK